MSWNPFLDAKDSPWDFILLAGQRSPGLCDIKGASSPRKWDEAQGYGLSGAILRFTGLGLAKFSVVLRLYEPAHWEAWQSFKAIVQKPPQGVRPKALDIYHPALEQLEIKAVVVEEVSQPEQTGDTGEWSITIEFREWRRPRPQLAVPDRAQASVADPYDDKIRGLTAVYQGLANG